MSNYRGEGPSDLRAGVTANRPAPNLVPAGWDWFDRTLGYPLVSDGASWYDHNGAAVGLAGNDGSTVFFRTPTAQPSLYPAFLGARLPVTAQTPVPTGTGVYRDVNSAATWTSAMAAALPGDVIRITATINAQLTARGNKYGIGGANMTASPGGGTAANPIIITCNAGAFIDPGNQSNSAGALDIFNVSHVWAVGVNVRNSTFGIRCMNLDGTTAAPVRIAWCTSQDTGNAAIAFQGWFQPIATSGGTPPGGVGNEYGFSSNAIIEANTIQRPGRTNTALGEGIYLGRGSAPGWVGYAFNVIARYNDVTQFTSDGIDVKPGCRLIRVHDNQFHNGSAVSGAGMSILYVSQDLNSRSGQFLVDPEVWVEGNRVWDINLTTTNVGSANYGAYMGLSGIRYAHNAFWSLSGSGIGIRAFNELTAADFGNHTTWVVNNLFWCPIGFSRGGTGFGGSINAAGLDGIAITERNNLGPTGGTGMQFTTAGTAFRAAVPATGVAGDATWLTYGSGAAFDLVPTGPLVNTGVSISDLPLFFNDQDISQRRFAESLPNPGPFRSRRAYI